MTTMTEQSMDKKLVIYWEMPWDAMTEALLDKLALILLG